MKIAITGATGQLGKIVIEKLKEKTAAENIVALARNIEKASVLNVEVKEFNYENSGILESALEGINKLLLISGSEIGKRLSQHTNVIKAAKKAGVNHIIYTSLLKADTSSISLAGEHRDTEKVLKESGINYTILRNGWYTENYTGSLSDVISLGTLYGSSGEGKISSATREDYAEAAAVVLAGEGHENKTYELAGDESFTMSDLAEEISKQSGKDIPYANIPVKDYAQALVGAGLPEVYAEILADSHVSTEKGDLFDDSHQLSSLIGRTTTTLSKAISDVL